MCFLKLQGLQAITRVIYYYTALSLALIKYCHAFFLSAWYQLLLRLHWGIWPAPSFLHRRLWQLPERSSALRGGRVWRTHTPGHRCCGHSFPHTDELDHGWDGAVPAPVGQEVEMKIKSSQIPVLVYVFPNTFNISKMPVSGHHPTYRSDDVAWHVKLGMWTK